LTEVVPVIVDPVLQHYEHSANRSVRKWIRFKISRSFLFVELYYDFVLTAIKYVKYIKGL
jgi:hypothetical protein